MPFLWFISYKEPHLTSIQLYLAPLELYPILASYPCKSMHVKFYPAVLEHSFKKTHKFSLEILNSDFYWLDRKKVVSELYHEESVNVYI